jgi:hypothetical protein
MSPPIDPEGREQAAPAPDEPSGLRAAGRRFLARLVPRFGEGIGAAEAAEFDAAARQAYQAALKLDMGSRAPASPPSRPADAPGPVPEFTATAEAEASVWATRPSLPEVRLVDLPGQAPEPASAALHRRQPGENTAPGSLLRTPSNVTLVADEFFDSLIRRVESDH